MTPLMQAACAALVGKWRESAARHKEHGDCYRVGKSWGLTECADELAALIQVPEGEIDAGRLADQCQDISRLMSEAGVPSMTLTEGVRYLIERAALLKPMRFGSHPKDGTWLLGWDEDCGFYVFRDGPSLIRGEDPEPQYWWRLPSVPTVAPATDGPNNSPLDWRGLLERARVAMNPPDIGGISLHEWSQRMKQVTTEINAALAASGYSTHES